MGNGPGDVTGSLTAAKVFPEGKSDTDSKQGSLNGAKVTAVNVNQRKTFSGGSSNNPTKRMRDRTGSKTSDDGSSEETKPEVVKNGVPGSKTDPEKHTEPSASKPENKSDAPAPKARISVGTGNGSGYAEQQEEFENKLKPQLGFLDKHAKETGVSFGGLALVLAGGVASIAFPPAGLLVYTCGIMVLSMALSKMLNEYDDDALPPPQTPSVPPAKDKNGKNEGDPKNPKPEPEDDSFKAICKPVLDQLAKGDGKNSRTAENIESDDIEGRKKQSIDFSQQTADDVDIDEFKGDGKNPITAESDESDDIEGRKKQSKDFSQQTADDVDTDELIEDIDAKIKAGLRSGKPLSGVFSEVMAKLLLLAGNETITPDSTELDQVIKAIKDTVDATSTGSQFNLEDIEFPETLKEFFRNNGVDVTEVVSERLKGASQHTELEAKIERTGNVRMSRSRIEEVKGAKNEAEGLSEVNLPPLRDSAKTVIKELFELLKEYKNISKNGDTSDIDSKVSESMQPENKSKPKIKQNRNNVLVKTFSYELIQLFSEKPEIRQAWVADNGTKIKELKKRVKDIAHEIPLGLSIKKKTDVLYERLKDQKFNDATKDMVNDLIVTLGEWKERKEKK